MIAILKHHQNWSWQLPWKFLTLSCCFIHWRRISWGLTTCVKARTKWDHQQGCVGQASVAAAGSATGSWTQEIAKVGGWNLPFKACRSNDKSFAWGSAVTHHKHWELLVSPLGHRSRRLNYEWRDSLRWGRVGIAECLIYLGSHMGNDLIIELVFS